MPQQRHQRVRRRGRNGGGRVSTTSPSRGTRTPTSTTGRWRSSTPRGMPGACWKSAPSPPSSRSTEARTSIPFPVFPPVIPCERDAFEFSIVELVGEALLVLFGCREVPTGGMADR
jgi:hypothetical protein